MSKSQNESIATFLAKPGARLTALDALRMFNCLRVAARIDELRKAGMAIQTTMVQHGKSRVAEYSMAVES